MSKFKPHWPDGPWDSEPDHDEWRHLGLPCMVHRNPMGALCGYVAVPEGHPWYEKDYDSCRVGEEWPEVHGGLTYAAHRQDGGPLCHVPRPGESERVWWVGFDCNHLGDESPGMIASDRAAGFASDPTDTYKTINYVRRQVEYLAMQARKEQGWSDELIRATGAR